MRYLPGRTRALLAATAVVAVASAIVAAQLPARGAPVAWLVFAAAAGFGELLSVRGDETVGTPSFTFSTSVLVAAAALFGPAPAGLIAFSVLALVDLVRGAEIVRLLFNAATYGIAGVWAAVAYAAAGGTPTIVSDDLLPLACLVAVHLAVQVVLIGSVVGSTRGRRFLPSIGRYASTAVLPQITEYSLALVLALLASAAPVFAPLLLPLLLAIFRAHARSAALRRETEVALRRLADVVDERDPSTFDHSHRVGELVRTLGHALQLPDRDVEMLARAGRLHDLGKIMVDRSVLQKPGKLDDDEFAQVRLHPAVSARLLDAFGFARTEARSVELHHERFDGRGYYRVPPDEIPLAAHCLILADAWDAMTSDRPYRPGMSAEVAAGRVAEGMGSQFHPVLGRAFLAVQEGRRPEDVLDAAELRGLRHGLATAWTPPSVGAAVRAGWLAAEPRLVRVLAAAAFASLAVAATVPIVAPAMAVGAVGCTIGAVATALHRRRELDDFLAGLAMLGRMPSLTDLVGVVDRHAGVAWAGDVVAERANSLSRGDQAWRSPVASQRLEEALDGRLAQIAGRLRPGGRWDGEVAGLRLLLVPRGDRWLGLATERPLPAAVANYLEAGSAGPRPMSPAVAAHEVAAA